MKVNWSIKGHKVHILIDSGSTHNFIDSFTSKQLGCSLLEHSPMIVVVVANGERIRCDKICAGLKWKMQGVECEADLMVLPLEGYQIVLGI